MYDTSEIKTPRCLRFAILLARDGFLEQNSSKKNPGEGRGFNYYAANLLLEEPGDTGKELIVKIDGFHDRIVLGAT